MDLGGRDGRLMELQIPGGASVLDKDDIKAQIRSGPDAGFDAHMGLHPGDDMSPCDQYRPGPPPKPPLPPPAPPETDPVDKNDMAAGKANNRRVEFVKIWASSARSPRDPGGLPTPAHACPDAPARGVDARAVRAVGLIEEVR